MNSLDAAGALVASTAGDSVVPVHFEANPDKFVQLLGVVCPLCKRIVLEYLLDQCASLNFSQSEEDDPDKSDGSASDPDMPEESLEEESIEEEQRTIDEAMSDWSS